MNDREQALAARVVEAKDDLKSALLAAGCPSDGRFEDTARQLAETGEHPDVQGALLDFQSAVNALWLHAESTGLTEKLVRRWRGWRRKRVRESGVDAAEFSAEATFAIRGAITRFEPGRAPLIVFAQREVYAALDSYLGRSVSPASLSSRQARRQQGSAYACLNEE